MIKNKVLILVLSSENSPYDLLEDSIRNTWLKLNKYSVPVFFYYGSNGDDNKIIDDKIYLKIFEDYGTITQKTLLVFELIYNNFDFDFIYRTNSSSYVDINLLYEHLETIKPENFYSGVTARCSGIDFCSGCGYFLSRDLVKLIVENKEKCDINMIDDKSIGQFLTSNGVPLTNADRIDFPVNNPSLDCFHYRCKESCGDRNQDIKNMNLIYELKKQNESNNSQ